jgi:hypothetical protein
LICQSEAAFDLLVAAQHQEPSEDNARALNKRLKWQMDHTDRGLIYITLDISTAKLFVFIDRLFINNKDFSSQLEYKIIMANKITGQNEFIIKGNLIYWSFTKNKRITRSILASEIYGMVGGVDIAIIINSIIRMIIKQLDLSDIYLIIYIDFYSFYKCLVKLGTIHEKRLIIDIIILK